MMIGPVVRNTHGALQCSSPQLTKTIGLLAFEPFIRSLNGFIQVMSHSSCFRLAVPAEREMVMKGPFKIFWKIPKILVAKIDFRNRMSNIMFNFAKNKKKNELR